MAAMDVLIDHITIDSEDKHCGHIYLHEPSMMLKFVCLFCEKTYDDINYYCNHLAEHVHADFKSQEAEKLSEVVHKENSPYSSVTAEESQVNGRETNSVNNSNYITRVGNSGNVDEENVDSANSCTDALSEYTELEEDEDEKESRQFLFDSQMDCYADESNGDDTTFGESEVHVRRVNEIEIPILTSPASMPVAGAEQKKDKANIEISTSFASMSVAGAQEGVSKIIVPNSTAPAPVSIPGVEEGTDFESLIGNAKILKPPKNRFDHILPPDKGGPPIKTFKIITLKNQIDELYDMVQKAGTEITKKNIMSSNKIGIERTTRIIGKTVITSLPVEVDVDRLTNARNDEYRCHACNKTFRNHQSLALHGRAHYMESQSDIKVAHRCTDCNELFSRIKDLQLHIQQVHYPEGFKCRLCHKVMRSIALLEAHMRKTHLRPKTYRCKLCGLIDFNNLEDFQKHTKSHEKEAKFKCYVCGRQFTLETNLKQHMLRHNRKKGERCVVCGKVTQRLTQHMKIHSPRPSRLLQCSICNKTFSFSSALSRHTKVMHKLPRTGRIKAVRNENSINSRRPKKVLPPAPSAESAISNEIEKEGAELEVACEEVVVGTEEKKVVVEMIENGLLRRAIQEDILDNMDCTVARYETIAAVQSITDPKKNS